MLTCLTKILNMVNIKPVNIAMVTSMLTLAFILRNRHASVQAHRAASIALDLRILLMRNQREKKERKEVKTIISISFAWFIFSIMAAKMSTKRAFSTGITTTKVSIIS